MDRTLKLELFEQIRREYEFVSTSIRAVAKKLGVHRRLVRHAMLVELPSETYKRRSAFTAGSSQALDRLDIESGLTSAT